MKKIRDSVWFPPFIVFVAIMVIVISSFGISIENRQQERKTVANEYTKTIEVDVRQRLEVFEEILRSNVGFVTVIEGFSKGDWRVSIEASKVLERFPGMQGIAYTELVDLSEKDAFEQDVRQTDPNFSIFPEGSRDSYAVIRYLEPQNERNNSAIGFDMYSEDIRRQAILSARDSNRISITDPIKLVQEVDQDQQFGLIIYAPAYKNRAQIDTIEQRQENIEGYVSVVLRTEDFLSNLFQDKEVDNLGFSFYSNGENEDVVLYESDSYKKLINKEVLETDRLLSIYGADFGIAVAYDSASTLPESFSDRSSTILFFGTFAAALISVITYLLLRGKANQLALIQERNINDAKDSLLSIASHQLRTPATGVKQYLGMVLQGFVGDVSEQQNSMLHKAYESNERQLKTINDILFLARVDSGRIVLSKNKIDVKALITSIVDEQKDKIEESQHTVVAILPKKKVLASIDEHTIRMTVENLLSNAIKYTKSGGKIKIEVKQNNHNTMIAIIDNGVGIAEDDENKLFKQFSRVKNPLSKSVSGTGIGLYLAKHIVDLHNGEIQVSSELNKGSTFTIVLPRS